MFGVSLLLIFLLGSASVWYIFQNPVLAQSHGKTCNTTKGVVGTCTLLMDCKILKHLETPDDNPCGQNYICCPTITIKSNYNLLPSNCGISTANINTRITHGDRADLFEFPWQVALKYETTLQWPFLCGGSLISNRYVLTAAHCIETSFKLIAVRLGEYDFSTNPDCEETPRGKLCAPKYLEIEVGANDSIVHENYVTSNLDNDIALIRLPTVVEFAEHIAPICLPINEYATWKHNELTVIGWGYTEYGNPSEVLMKVTVPYVRTPRCKIAIGGFIDINHNQLCAGGIDGKDSCIGDSGGPIMFSESDGEDEERWIQVGLVSFGPTHCGTNGTPGVYTRLTEYIDWILNHMKP